MIKVGKSLQKEPPPKNKQKKGGKKTSFTYRLHSSNYQQLNNWKGGRTTKTNCEVPEFAYFFKKVLQKSIFDVKNSWSMKKPSRFCWTSLRINLANWGSFTHKRQNGFAVLIGKITKCFIFVDHTTLDVEYKTFRQHKPRCNLLIKKNILIVQFLFFCHKIEIA